MNISDMLARKIEYMGSARRLAISTGFREIVMSE
jgi:hypothetical protein